MEILASNPIYNTPVIYHIIFALSIVIGIFAGCLTVFDSILELKLSQFFIGLFLIILGIIGINYSNKATDRTSYIEYFQYKIIIDDSISAKELLNKYEILSKEGNIFTVREIKIDEDY